MKNEFEFEKLGLSIIMLLFTYDKIYPVICNGNMIYIQIQPNSCLALVGLVCLLLRYIYVTLCMTAHNSSPVTACLLKRIHVYCRIVGIPSTRIRAEPFFQQLEID